MFSFTGTHSRTTVAACLCHCANTTRDGDANAGPIRRALPNTTPVPDATPIAISIWLPACHATAITSARYGGTDQGAVANVCAANRESDYSPEAISKWRSACDTTAIVSTWNGGADQGAVANVGAANQGFDYNPRAISSWRPAYDTTAIVCH